MCYDIKTKLETQLKRARRKGDKDWQEELKRKIEPYTKDYFYVSGFAHPMLVVYTQDAPYHPTLATWGLVPSWTKDEAHKNKLWNSTLNARVETITEKPSFKESTEHKRCILQVDGFYEHKHYNGKAYPYYIYHADQTPITLAALWSQWNNQKYFTIVTTRANELMSTIHINPKISEPRMPLILDKPSEELWLLNKHIEFQNIAESTPNLQAHTVKTLRGIHGIGNTEEASSPHTYNELNTLFK